MTDRVVAFEINAAQVQAAQPARPAPEVSRPSHPVRTSRVVSRAGLLATYAAWLGESLSTADLEEALEAEAAGNALDLSAMARVLTAQGLLATVVKVADPVPDQWPALVQMTSGHVVLVLAQDAEWLTIYDPKAEDLRAEVALADFTPVFSGQVLQARPALARIAEHHLPDARKPHWFWGEFAHYRRALAEVAAGSLVANLLAVAVSLFSLQVYDRVIPHQSQPTLWVLALGAMLAIGFEMALKMARSGLMDHTGRRIELTTQARLMQRLLGMRAAPAERTPSQIFATMREYSSVREFFTASTIGTLADLPFLIIFLVLVASIGGNLVLVLIAGAILMVLPGLLMQKKMVALTQATQGASMKAARLLHEAVYEHETVTTQRGQARIARIWAELSALSAAKASDQRHLTAFLSYWAGGVQQATYVAAVLVGTYKVFAGEFTVGTIIAIGILTNRTLGPLSQLSTTLARWTNVQSALKGLDSIADARQIEEEGRQYLRRDRLTGAFELKGLEFRYDPTAAQTVDIAALAIPAGQHVAVLGANGSGKSTLLRLLAGLYEPTAGRVLIDGLDLNQIHPRDLRRHVGYLGQDVRLMAGTIRDNLNLGQLERDDNRLLAALDFAGLGPFVRNHPRGLDLEIRELGEGLSVGQRQSIGWARLWLQDPGVVLLDEPTAALDQTLEATLVSRLKTWLEGRTAIIATHRVPILQLTTRTLILQNGRMAVDGPRDAVLAHLSKAGGAK